MLKGVTRGKRRPPRVVLYGPPGVGKSTFGADAESPLFVPTEDGVDNVPVDAFGKAASWTELLENVRQVATEKHDYKTLVIDTLNGAAELCADHIVKTLFGGQRIAQKGNGGYEAFGKGEKATAEEMRALLALMDDCRARGMTVLLLGHTGLQNVQHPTEGGYTKFAPEMPKAAWAKVSAWADIVLRADYEYTILKNGGPKGRAIGSSTRIVYAAGEAAADAKCRVGYELPDTFGLSYDEFAAHLGSGASTLEEIKTLWPLLSEQQAREAIAWLGCDDIADAPLTKARKLLNRLRQIAAEKNNNQADEAENKEKVA